MMTTYDPGNTSRFAGLIAICAAACMITGAILWVLSGADLDAALIEGTMETYLNDAAETSSLLIANLTAWIIGVFLIGIAGGTMALLSEGRRPIVLAAQLCFWTGVPLAISSFVAWLAVIVQIAPGGSATDIMLAQVIGWYASKADWIATVLIVGFGPWFITRAGRGGWIPSWLSGWGYLTAIAGVLTIIAMFAGGLTTYGFLIVPIGLGWFIAAGIFLLRKQ